jgi:hypothetical protein
MIPLFSNNAFYQPHPLLHDLNPTGLIQSYYQQANLRAYESMVRANQARSQLFSMMQMKNQLLQTALKNQVFQCQMDVKAEDTVSTTSNSLISPQESFTPERLRPEPISMSIEQPKFTKSKAKKDGQNFPLVKAELEEMIYFLLNNIGKIDQGEIEKARRKYSQNLYLVPVFDALVAKYFPVKKHREDIVRYVVRRAFKFLKAGAIKKEKVYGKRAYAILCKKYFQSSYEELQKSGVNTEDEKELIEFLLPYRKNSKNRTMNNNFTTEIFSSQEFCADYEIFLKSFDKVLIDDNNKKIEKLISLAEECIANNCPEKIKQCTRLPWLQAWIEKTQEIAYDLPKSGIKPNEEFETNDKKVKVGNEPALIQPVLAGIKLEGNY